jgi:hypothetical protein
LTAINTPHILKIVGWIYKVSGDSFWKLWNKPEKPTHIVDHATTQGMKIEIEAVYDINEDVAKRNLVDSVEVVHTLLEANKDKEDTEAIEISVGLLRQVATVASCRKIGGSKEEFERLQTLVAKLENESISHQSEMIEVLKDCRTYIKRSEFYAKTLRDYQQLIASSLDSDDEDGAALYLPSGNIVRGEVADVMSEVFNNLKETINKALVDGQNISTRGNKNE